MTTHIQTISASRASPSWATELSAQIALALPLVLGNIAWSGVAASDLFLLGKIGADAVAAGALALNIYNAFLVAGMGIVGAASPLIASERGRRRHSVRDIRRTVRQAIWAAIAFALPAWLILWHGEAILLRLGQDPALSRDAGTLMHSLQWALLPYLVLTTLRQFLSALERPIWTFVVIAVSLPVNLLLGWSLIFGHFGMPALGLFGAGLASTLTAAFMALGLSAVILIDRRFRRYRLFGRWWVADWARFRDIWQIGTPIAITIALEVTVFNASVFLMGLIDRASLAAHAVAIQIASVAFMMPMGIGQAATVRVGLAYGARDRAGVGRAGWVSLGLGCACATVSAAILLLWPRPFMAIFIDVTNPANAEVVRLCISFLAVAAFFQLFDCAQAIGAGALRGLHDTRVPMLFAAVGYWVFGIGTSVLLGFPLGMRGLGVWIGLATGLGLVAVLLVWRWANRERLGLVGN
ncbi:MATE family efflux transporter [Sphingomonas sp. MMS24-J13]|uniref:MATE family efflux transporter n=1 Tax=Sphingomonas sp. MMS24-J13 TaxID=3238686 RepID=UPI00384A7D20